MDPSIAASAMFEAVCRFLYPCASSIYAEFGIEGPMPIPRLCRFRDPGVPGWAVLAGFCWGKVSA